MVGHVFSIVRFYILSPFDSPFFFSRLGAATFICPATVRNLPAALSRPNTWTAPKVRSLHRPSLVFCALPHRSQTMDKKKKKTEVARRCDVGHALCVRVCCVVPGRSTDSFVAAVAASKSSVGGQGQRRRTCARKFAWSVPHLCFVLKHVRNRVIGYPLRILREPIHFKGGKKQLFVAAFFSLENPKKTSPFAPSSSFFPPPPLCFSSSARSMTPTFQRKSEKKKKDLSKTKKPFLPIPHLPLFVSDTQIAYRRRRPGLFRPPLLFRGQMAWSFHVRGFPSPSPLSSSSLSLFARIVARTRDSLFPCRLPMSFCAHTLPHPTAPLLAAWLSFEWLDLARLLFDLLARPCPS